MRRGGPGGLHPKVDGRCAKLGSAIQAMRRAAAGPDVPRATRASAEVLRRFINPPSRRELAVDRAAACGNLCRARRREVAP